MADLFSSLKNELIKQQKCLLDVDVNLKRFTGRDFNEPRGERRPRLVSTVRETRDEEPPAKRRVPGVFARLGAPVLDGQRDNNEMSQNIFRGRSVREVQQDNFVVSRRRSSASKSIPDDRFGQETFDELPRDKFKSKDVPSIQSAISRPAPPDGKTRTQALEALTKDKQTNARNRRMFSTINGLLSQFKKDEVKLKDKDDKRAKIEKKLEEKGHAEKEEMKKERAQLVIQKRNAQSSIKELEYKMSRVTEHNDWEGHQRKLKCYIRTKTKPNIFWMPKNSSSSRSIQSLIRATGDNIEMEIKEEKVRLTKVMDKMFPEKQDSPKRGNRISFDGRKEDPEKFKNGSIEVKEEKGHHLKREVVEERFHDKWEDNEEQGVDDSFINRSNILDYDPEDGELVSEPWLPGKIRKNAERMVVQVDSTVDSVSVVPARRVAMVTVTMNDPKDEKKSKKRVNEENGCEKEHKRRKESGDEKKSKERMKEKLNKSVSEMEMCEEYEENEEIEASSPQKRSSSRNKKGSRGEDQNGLREKSNSKEGGKEKLLEDYENFNIKRNKKGHSSRNIEMVVAPQADLVHKEKETKVSHKEKDIAVSHKVKDIAVSHKVKDIAVSHKEKDIAVSHKVKDIAVSHKVKDIAVSHKEKERVSSHKEKESRVSSHKEKENKVVSSHKEKESKISHKDKEDAIFDKETVVSQKEKEAAVSQKEKVSPYKEKVSSHRDRKNKKDEQSKKEHRHKESKSTRRSKEQNVDNSQRDNEEIEEVWSEDLSHISLPLGPSVTELVVQHGDEMEAILIPTSQIKKDQTVYDPEEVNTCMTIKKEKNPSPVPQTKKKEKIKNETMMSNAEESSSDSDDQSSDDSSSASSSDSEGTTGNADSKKKKATPRYSKKDKAASSSESSSSSSESSSSDSESSSEDEKKSARKRNSKSPRRQEVVSRQKIRDRNVDRSRRPVSKERRSSRDRRSAKDPKMTRDRRSSRERKQSRSGDRRRERR